MPSVLVVDDDIDLLEMVELALTNHQMKVNCLNHGATLFDSIEKVNPDIILMDINLAGGSGIDLCKKVRETYPSVFVIGLSTFNQISFIKSMMDNGASGYLLKNAGYDEIIEALGKVMLGQEYMSLEASLAMR